ncbi:MAG: hypothetical protein Q8916_02435 [Bacteroidota bacterium]|nr:hypothetical protein [Bacteroidota bacterium]MDP4235540.1 hypothetical protein [Bacteroidota bacterium]
MYKLVIATFILLAFGATALVAQTNSLRGGSLVLSNGTNTITLKPPSSGLTNYTLALDTNRNSTDSTRWLMNDGAGNLSWSAKPGGLTGNGVQYVPGAPQQTATTGNYLFYLQNLNTAANINSVGAFVASTVVDGINSSAVGLSTNVTNTLASATGVTMGGFCLNSANVNGSAGSSCTQIGATINATGGGVNHAGIFMGGNVGFGTATPGEPLEVVGNIRISGQKGLKITEGANGTMGLATLVGGTVVVNTTKVTASSRIFLMSQNGAAATVGTPYISARTAATSFTITSTSATDVSNVAWWIVEP